MDLTDAFWSIRIRDRDIEKTAFTTKLGLWEFVSMPFGLCNAPPTQQRFMDAVLSGLTGLCCFVYMDDILCFSPSFKQHLDDLRSIFTRLRDNNLVIQPSKCAFCRPSFDLLVFTVTKDGLAANSSKVSAVLQLPFPDTKAAMLSFLGGVSWLRKLIPHCSALTSRLKALTGKDMPNKIEPGLEHVEDFNAIKDILTSPIVMAHPDFNKTFIFTSMHHRRA